MTLRQVLYVFLGSLNVGLGVAGIFLPLLPTTPFLLLAAFLFARSSPRLHRWLLAHPHLSPYIHAFRGKAGLTRSQKGRIIVSITVVMWASAWFAPYVWLKAMLLVMWAFWTALILRIKTANPPVDDAPAPASHPDPPAYVKTDNADGQQLRRAESTNPAGSG